MQTIEIRKWDDLHAREEAARVPADLEAEVELRLGKVTRRVRMDLTAAHGKELEALLARYFEIGRAHV